MLTKVIKLFKKGIEKRTATVKAFNLKELEVDVFERSTGIEKWGFILTLTMEDGNEIDCIWETWKSKRGIKNFDSKSMATIPSVLKAIGVKEFSELIGTVVKVKISGDTIRIASESKAAESNNSKGYWIFPDMFDVKSDDHTLKNLLNRLRAGCPIGLEFEYRNGVRVSTKYIAFNGGEYILTKVQKNDKIDHSTVERMAAIEMIRDSITIMKEKETQTNDEAKWLDEKIQSIGY